ncbi:MAG TPA: peptidylprolyl isomerase [Phycisphaerae bacterium]|nr:peptidylprolyl isomerase [Phycisphaerae bacterium]
MVKSCYPGFGRAVTATLCLLSTYIALGQSPGARTDAADFAFRAEVSNLRPIYRPGEPVIARLTLVNTTDQIAELSADDRGEHQDAVGLVSSLVYGGEHDPALFIAYEEEPPTPILRPANADEPASERTVRVGPRGVIGAEIDLTALHRGLRYSGEYRIEWRPLGGRFGTARAVFRVEQRQGVVIVTDLGRITFTLAYDDAPLNVANFLDLVRSGFYEGKTFHRLIPGFLLQGGCPHGTGRGTRPDGKTVPAELTERPFELGTLAMAHRPNDLNSASCQFFISLGRNPELDGQYSIIGQTSDDESLRTLAKLSQVKLVGDRPARTMVITNVRLVPEARVTGRSEAALPPW